MGGRARGGQRAWPRAEVKAWPLFQPQQQKQVMQGLSAPCKDLESYLNFIAQCGRLRNDCLPPHQRYPCPNPQKPVNMLLYLTKRSLQM